MKHSSPFTQQDYEIVKDEVIYEGFVRLKRYHLKTKKYAGGWTPVFLREVCERQPAVAILPYDPELDKVVLIEQFRAGTLGHKESAWVLEIVAGLIEQEETPECVARREAQEEAGVEISELELITDYFVSPGASNEYISVYCGRVNAANNAGGIFGLAVEEEDIRALVLDRREALQLVQEKQIKTAPAIVSLLWLQQNCEWLKQKWLTN